MENKPQIQKVYSLSPMQEGMLFHAELDSTSSAYFEQTVFSLRGSIDTEAFEKSFNQLIKRHDILRTIFFYKNVQRFSQVVLKERTTTIHYEDITHMAEQDKEQYVKDFLEADRKNGFDLSRDMLIRISILKTQKDFYKLIWSFHHILMDGWCIGIINKEMLEIYSSLINNTPLKLGEVPLYKDYIDWLKKQDKKEAEDYWTKYLDAYENQAVVPQYKLKNASEEYIKEDMSFKLNKRITDGLAAVAKKNKTTLNTVIQAIWGILLQRYNNTNDVVFGSVVSGRGAELEGIEEMVGLFINTVPVRVKSEGSMSFTALALKIQEDALLSERYSYCSLVDIQKCSTLKNGLFNHIIAYENYPLDQALDNMGDSNKLGFVLEDVESFEQTNYDFNIAIVPGDELTIVFKYNANAYDKSFIEAIGCHITEAAERIVENPDIAVCDIDIVHREEKDKILKDFNNTKTNYPKTKTLNKLFEEMVDKYPDNTALVFEDKQLTYRELNEKANQLARVLRDKGYAAKSLIGMMVERSFEMIIGIMAILKAGGAYLPIDPDYPDARITGILEDSETPVVLTQSSVLKRTCLSDISGIEIIVIDEITDMLSEKSTENMEAVNSWDDLAYVMYTSGSTGKPKGNLITHYNISRVVLNTNYIDIDEKDILLQLSTYAFDGSTFDIYGALLNGAKLVMVNKDALLDMTRLSELIAKEEITLFFITTSLFNALVDVNIECLKTIRKVLTGGERISIKHASKALAYMGEGRLVHVYGPTESTVYATSYNINNIDEKNPVIPIGKPIANTQIYVMNSSNKLQPIGIPGELCISGDGLAAGYLKRPELTAEKFIPNPFIQGERIYKTGDLVRWLPDGNIEFLDRIDTQVKLRGFRIELGEIEARLLTYEGMKEAVVLCRQNEEGSKFLYAYLVADKELSVPELRNHLSQELPDYMVPSYFSQLDIMPLTPNGKVDKNALDAYEKMESGVEYAAARNDIEGTLVAAWEEVLGVKGIGINDNYFSQGGDSIKAIQIASKLQKENLKMEIRDLFQHPTIGELSSYIKAAGKKAEQAVVKGELPMTPIQKWFFENQFTDMHHFNHAVMLHSKNGFEDNILRKVFTKLVEHHDALRIVYKMEEGSIKQYNRAIEGQLFELETVDLTNEADCRAKIEEIANKVQSSINIAEGPLVKIRQFKTLNGDHLLIVIHHLVVDGVSWRIILEDIATGYMQASKGQNVVLQEKTTSFKQWSEKLSAYGSNEKLKEEAKYWEEVADNEVIPLPRDNQSAENRIKDSNYITVELSEEDTEKLLKDVNTAYNTEINDILISALCRAIRKWCGHEKFLINMEGHGREDIIEDVDINRTVGWFTSAYPVVLKLEKSDDIAYSIKSVKDELNRIPQNGVGYGLLRYLSSIETKAAVSLKHQPEISFNYLGQFDQDIKTDVFSASEYPVGNLVSPEMERSHTLDINGLVKDNKLSMTIGYNKHEYNYETIERLAQIYKTSILENIEHCTKKDATEYTPTDFLYNDFSIDELDDLTDELGDILD